MAPGPVLQELARTIAHALGQPDPDLGPDPETIFRQEWLPAVLDDLPEGSSLVLLFDEFDVLADPQKEQAAAAFFPYLRGLLASDPQRLQLVFVIGRNVDDLDTITLSLFKGTPYRRVSLLNWEDTADLELELRALAKRGLVAEDEAIPGGWRVRPQAFLWWLADELVRTVRRETPFEEWLQAQGWEGLLTRGEKQQLDKGVRAVTGLLKGGVTTLIEAAAKGAGEAIVKGG